jgi:hypothetical protein
VDGGRFRQFTADMRGWRALPGAGKGKPGRLRPHRPGVESRPVTGSRLRQDSVLGRPRQGGAPFLVNHRIVKERIRAAGLAGAGLPRAILGYGSGKWRGRKDVGLHNLILS